MTAAQILDGKATAATIKSEIATRVARLREQGVVAGLGTVLVGDDPGSRAYVAGKHRDCAEVGLESIRVDLPAETSQEELEAEIVRLNGDSACTGYIVQLPLPAHLNSERILELMDPGKDADGLHPMNLGRLVLSVSGALHSPLPCTPQGVVELLSRHGVSLAGANVVVVGRGVTVGRPLGLLLTRKSVNATVTLCHTGTTDLRTHLAQADVVVAAAGVPAMIAAETIRPGAVVLDVGITRVPVVDSDGQPTGKTRLVGDVAQDVRETASWVAPMPGGVGPMTRAMLLQNLVELAERQAGIA